MFVNSLQSMSFEMNGDHKTKLILRVVSCLGTSDIHYIFFSVCAGLLDSYTVYRFLSWFIVKCLLVFTGSALQWPIRSGKPPRCLSLEPLHVEARVQLPRQLGPCGVQAFPFPGDWGHTGHWSEEALWLRCWVQCQGIFFFISNIENIRFFKSGRFMD